MDAVNVRLRRWHPRLRQAVEKVRPDYFTWSAQRRDRYGVSISQEDLEALRRTLLSDGAVRSGLSTTAKATVDAVELGPDEQRLCDEMLLPLRGIGEDCFYLDEVPDPSSQRTLADFETVRELDESVCRFQHTPATAHHVSLGLRPYRGALYFNQAQLYIDGGFNYAKLSMAAGCIYARLSDCWRKLLHDRIPYHYVCGKHHGKVTGRYWLWDMRMIAAGQEGIVKELQRRIWRYQWRRFDTVLAAWDARRRSCVYLLRDGDSAVHIVFSDKDALERVRFRSFVRDCRAIEGCAEELFQVEREEEARLKQFIDEQYAAVVRAYDPKVTTLRPYGRFMLPKQGTWRT